MKTEFLPPSQIPLVLKKYLAFQNTVFVFPSDIASDSWSDWAVKNPDVSGVKTVPLDQFTAWDKFKSEFAVAENKGQTSIPSLLRKLFVRSLITENAEAAAAGKPLFKSLIPPDFAGSAYSFTDWISKILPSLKLWHKKYSEWISAESGSDSDEENMDYLFLYGRYRDFLEQNGLFEPSWLTPDFTEKEKTFIIFYPETLEDFSDYEDVFSSAGNVIVIKLPETSTGSPEVTLYPDSRMEIRRTALFIRRIVSEQKAEWNEIAVNVPDIETYRPYIEREFENYCIPYVFRSGIPFTKNCAGSIFREIKECRRNRFSYSSVRSLLLNGYVPWKEKQLNENLVREGSRLRCICSYEDGEKTVDVWNEAFNNAEGDEREKRMYIILKDDVNRMCSATSFSDVRKAWFIFRNHFLAENGFSAEADNILGRCLSELDNLIDIEKKYIEPLGLTVHSPFDFFLNELDGSTYRPQEKIDGVSVFPYRLAACADFKYQFVINAGQKALTVPFRKLGFLNSEKRRVLKLSDDDSASSAFIRLYAKNDTDQQKFSIFSAAEQTFSGFAITHNFLTVKNPEDSVTADAADFILNEKKWFLSGAEYGNAPALFTQRQKNAFFRWASCAAVPDFHKDEVSALSEPMLDKIKYLLYEKRHSAGNGSEKSACMKISQSDMKLFFPCPRRWVFKNVLNLKEDTLDTNLMQMYDAGNINHKILELVMKHFMEKDELIPCVSAGGIFENEQEIRSIIEDCTLQAFHSSEMEFRESPLAMAVLDSQKKNFADDIMSFLRKFCRKDGGFGGYKVKSVERWYSGRPESEKCEYIGKIDCILAEENGEFSIIDYKSGKPPSAKDCVIDKDGRLGDFQIAMYVDLLNMNNPESASVKNALFYSIRDGKPVYIVNDKKSIEDFKPTVSAFEKYAERFYEKVSAGQLVPYSDSSDLYNNVDVYKDCAECQFKTICRTAYSVAGRKLRRVHFGE